MLDQFKIFSIKNNNDFEKIAINLFQFQYHHTAIYKKYVDMLGVSVASVDKPEQIPFLPVSFFKSEKVLVGDEPCDTVFHSSTTTGGIPSKHFVRDASLYRESFLNTFSLFYGKPEQYVIIGLLPDYLERKNASLVYMVDELIRQSGKQESGFYLYDYDRLQKTLNKLNAAKQKVILFGVTHALLDFSSQYKMDLKDTIVIETGGMKGKGKELVREELHALLRKRLGLDEVHSEYGMTELLSQAYAKEHNRFIAPPWMKVMVRDPYDPFSYVETGGRGALNIIDLANIYTVSFIETQDVGVLNHDGSFQVLGRLDEADIRGCNLLI